MKNFVIAGAGGFGREVYSYLLNCIKSPGESVRGFLDDNPRALDGFGFAHKIISGFSAYAPLEGDAVVFAVANPKFKMQIAQILIERGAAFENFIHPSAVISKYAKIGIGAAIAPFCLVEAGAKIGDFVSINAGAKISNSAKIGKFSTISSNCVVGAGAELKDGVFMASSSILKSGAAMLENSFLGANSYAQNNVKKGETAFGNPALPL
ncbi:MAG: hypothetical protein IKS15_03380 [Opitutales bacterium]|nr:hypothetical protein [Opitutales bacterium]